MAVLLAGLISGRFAQRVLVPFIAAAALLTAMGLTIANWDAGDSAPIIEGALAIDTLALFMSMLFYVAGLATVLLSLRADVTREAGSGEYMALLLGSIAGMVIVAGAENLVTLFVGFELLSIPLYILCAGELRKRAVAGGGPEVPGGGLGGLGHAALRPRADLRRHRVHRLLGAMVRRDRRHGRSSATRCCSPAWRSPRWAWRSRRPWRPSTSGRPTSTRAPPPRSRASWPWPPRRRRSPSRCASSTWRCRASRPSGAPRSPCSPPPRS